MGTDGEVKPLPSHLRILHIDALASVPQRIAVAQRRLGHRADVLAFEDPRQLPVDIPVGPRRENGWTKLAMLDEFLTIMRVIDNYDIIHVHGGFGRAWFFYRWHALLHRRKRFFLHFHGSELRQNLNTRHHDLARRLFVISPDLLRYSANVGGRELTWVPNPYPVKGVPFRRMEWPEGAGSSVPLRIVHLPTQRTNKGTEHILRAVKRLKRKGYRIELDLVEGRPYAEAMNRLSCAHLCIDAASDSIDAYGMVSIEAMARGVPVLCRHDPGDYNDAPILDVRPGKIDRVIRELITSPPDVGNWSRRGRSYVKRVHDPVRIARRLIGYYREEIAR